VIESDQGALTNMQTHFNFTQDGSHTAQSAMNGTVDRDIHTDDVYENYLNVSVALRCLPIC
jgi:hypothetical protein